MADLIMREETNLLPGLKKINYDNYCICFYNQPCNEEISLTLNYHFYEIIFNISLSFLGFEKLL